MNMKRIFSLILALALALCFVSSAFAADIAGSSSDPLITKSYAEGSFKQSFITTARKTIQDKFEALRVKYVSPLTGSADTGAFRPSSVNSGGSIALSFGGSVIMTSGAARLTITSGTVVNVTTGTAVSSGGQLVANNRYMAVEDSSATISVTAKGLFLCDGAAEVTLGVPSASFSDVPESHWAFSEIETLAAAGIITGRGNGKFDPSANMIRGDFVTVLGRLHGIKTTDYTGSDFSDVSGNDYYAPHVKWASANQLVTGYSSTQFAPKDNVTRAQMATLIVRYADFAGITLPTGKGSGVKFADDAKIATWAYDAVYLAADAGLINGKGGNMFDPAGNATRAEICAIIYRLSLLK